MEAEMFTRRDPHCENATSPYISPSLPKPVHTPCYHCSVYMYSLALITVHSYTYLNVIVHQFLNMKFGFHSLSLYWSICKFVFFLFEMIQRSSVYTTENIVLVNVPNTCGLSFVPLPLFIDEIQ